MAIYAPSFFDAIRSGCQSSAAVVAPMVYEVLRPATVIDVGCGEGWWGKAFQALGCDVMGIDGHADQPVIDHFVRHDLAEPLPEMPQADLAVCLEVAEHLPAEHARRLVADLCRVGRNVLFSAAIPGQSGLGHVNCQWPGYWVDLFAGHHYAVSGALRFEVWHHEGVEPWYRQNLLVAVSGEPPVEWFNTPLAEPFPLVHPAIWRWVAK